MPERTNLVDSESLEEALYILSDISARARHMGLGLVADVERVVAVLTAGKPKLVTDKK